MASANSSFLTALLAPPRTRSGWNACLPNWEAPATPSEEARIERAAGMVRQVLSQNTWLTSQGVTVAAQGSYYNNTNVRLDADMDLRVTHPLVQFVYNEHVLVERAREELRHVQAPLTAETVARHLRAEIEDVLSDAFGAANVDVTGRKAVRLKALPGSRADVDIVPTLQLHYVTWNPVFDRYDVAKGIALFGPTGYTLNFPEQHYANGVAKRASTLHRFKRMVRIFKQLRNGLVEAGALGEKQAPSFLIECLVYAVEDEHFLVEQDDRLDRTRRVARRLLELSIDSAWVGAAREINGYKILFHPTQPWTSQDAFSFALAACQRLEV